MVQQVYAGVGIGSGAVPLVSNWRTKVRGAADTVRPFAATLPTKKADDCAVLPDPRTSPAIGRSQKGTKPVVSE